MLISSDYFASAIQVKLVSCPLNNLTFYLAVDIGLPATNLVEFLWNPAFFIFYPFQPITLCDTGLWTTALVHSRIHYIVEPRYANGVLYFLPIAQPI